MPYPMLNYRGNYSLTAGIDFAGTMLSAEYGGGLREDDVVFPPFRTWQLSYTALHKRVKVQLPSGEAVSRLEYVWGMYTRSKLGGNAPFIMRCPRDEKLYLCFFPEDGLTVQLVDRFLGTAGLPIRQVVVRGVTVNSDGSLPEGVTLP